MADEAATIDDGESAPTEAAEGGLRRWFRLSGAIALGSFVLVHLLVQASALGGATTYDAVAGALARSPLVAAVEIALVALPLLFHAVYGISLLLSKERAQNDLERFGGPRAWVAQRVSAVFVAIFVAVHLWDFTAQRVFFGLSSDALSTALAARLSWTAAGVPWVALFYLLGVFAVAFHLANGLYAATAAWGLWPSPGSRRRARVLTVGLGFALFVLGSASIVGIATGTHFLPGKGSDTAPFAPPCGSEVPPKAPIPGPSH